MYLLLFLVSIISVLLSLRRGNAYLLSVLAAVAIFWALAIVIPRRYRFPYYSWFTIAVSILLFLVLIALLFTTN
jgi:hypothetical protein